MKRGWFVLSLNCRFQDYLPEYDKITFGYSTMSPDLRVSPLYPPKDPFYNTPVQIPKADESLLSQIRELPQMLKGDLDSKAKEGIFTRLRLAVQKSSSGIKKSQEVYVDTIKKCIDAKENGPLLAAEDLVLEAESILHFSQRRFLCGQILIALADVNPVEARRFAIELAQRNLLYFNDAKKFIEVQIKRIAFAKKDNVETLFIAPHIAACAALCKQHVSESSADFERVIYEGARVLFDNNNADAALTLLHTAWDRNLICNFMFEIMMNVICVLDEGGEIPYNIHQIKQGFSGEFQKLGAYLWNVIQEKIVKVHPNYEEERISQRNVKIESLSKSYQFEEQCRCIEEALTLTDATIPKEWNYTQDAIKKWLLDTFRKNSENPAGIDRFLKLPSIRELFPAAELDMIRLSIADSVEIQQRKIIKQSQNLALQGSYKPILNLLPSIKKPEKRLAILLKFPLEVILKHLRDYFAQLLPVLSQNLSPKVQKKVIDLIYQLYANKSDEKLDLAIQILDRVQPADHTIWNEMMLQLDESGDEQLKKNRWEIFVNRKKYQEIGNFRGEREKIQAMLPYEIGLGNLLLRLYVQTHDSVFEAPLRRRLEPAYYDKHPLFNGAVNKKNRQLSFLKAVVKECLKLKDMAHCDPLLPAMLSCWSRVKEAAGDQLTEDLIKLAMHTKNEEIFIETVEMFKNTLGSTSAYTMTNEELITEAKRFADNKTVMRLIGTIQEKNHLDWGEESSKLIKKCITIIPNVERYNEAFEEIRQQRDCGNIGDAHCKGHVSEMIRTIFNNYLKNNAKKVDPKPFQIMKQGMDQFKLTPLQQRDCFIDAVRYMFRIFSIPDLLILWTKKKNSYLRVIVENFFSDDISEQTPENCGRQQELTGWIEEQLLPVCKKLNPETILKNSYFQCLASTLRETYLIRPLEKSKLVEYSNKICGNIDELFAGMEIPVGSLDLEQYGNFLINVVAIALHVFPCDTQIRYLLIDLMQTYFMALFNLSMDPTMIVNKELLASLLEDFVFYPHIITRDELKVHKVTMGLDLVKKAQQCGIFQNCPNVRDRMLISIQNKIPETLENSDQQLAELEKIYSRVLKQPFPIALLQANDMFFLASPLLKKAGTKKLEDWQKKWFERLAAFPTKTAYTVIALQDRCRLICHLEITNKENNKGMTLRYKACAEMIKNFIDLIVQDPLLKVDSKCDLFERACLSYWRVEEAFAEEKKAELKILGDTLYCNALSWYSRLWIEVNPTATTKVIEAQIRSVDKLMDKIQPITNPELKKQVKAIWEKYYDIQLEWAHESFISSKSESLNILFKAILFFIPGIDCGFFYKNHAGLLIKLEKIVVVYFTYVDADAVEVKFISIFLHLFEQCWIKLSEGNEQNRKRYFELYFHFFKRLLDLNNNIANCLCAYIFREPQFIRKLDSEEFKKIEQRLKQISISERFLEELIKNDPEEMDLITHFTCP